MRPLPRRWNKWNGGRISSCDEDTHGRESCRRSYLALARLIYGMRLAQKAETEQPVVQQQQRSSGEGKAALRGGSV